MATVVCLGCQVCFASDGRGKLKVERDKCKQCYSFHRNFETSNNWSQNLPAKFIYKFSDKTKTLKTRRQIAQVVINRCLGNTSSPNFKAEVSFKMGLRTWRAWGTALWNAGMFRQLLELRVNTERASVGLDLRACQAYPWRQIDKFCSVWIDLGLTSPSLTKR